MQALLTLLQINDSMFPIGGFTQSYGLETYVSLQRVHDTASAARYAENMLRYSVFYTDAALAGRAWDLCRKRKDYRRLQSLDEWATAIKSAYEIRQASHKLAIRFLKLALELQPYPFCQKYLEAINGRQAGGHYAIAFGMYCQQAGIDRTAALTAFYYNTLNAIVTNCAKTVPISQTAAQKILHQLKPAIEELVEAYPGLADEDVGLCCIGQEIRCMQHEKLYTRIYIS